MNVLLFTSYFPPSGEVGGLRARKVAESFVSRGHAVYVITAPVAGKSVGDARVDGVDVHWVEPSLDLRMLYTKLRRGTRRVADDRPADNDATPWKPPERSSFLKRQISSAMWLPDDRQGWIRPAARAGREIARIGIDLIYSTAPPFSVHLAALLAKQRIRAPWVAEFRDPWTDNPGKPDFVRGAWSDAIERRLERKCLAAADLVVTVTEPVARALASRLPTERRGKVIVVRNGIDTLEAPGGFDRPARSVVYLGSLYQKRDPRAFLAAIAELRRTNALPHGFHIDFVGDCRWLHGVSMEGIVNDIGLGGIVRFTDPVPHAQGLERIRSADLLLLLAQDQPMQVPNKLYEYLGVRRPILAFADGDGETARMLRQLGGHYIIDREASAFITETVAAAIAGGGGDPNAAGEALLEDWTASRQLVRLHDRLESLQLP